MTGAVRMLSSRRTRRELRATLRAGLLAIAVELAIRTVPLDRVTGWLGLQFMHGARPASDATRGAGADARLTLGTSERIACHAIARVMRRWPGPRGTCLREALLYGHALRARSPQLHVGAGTVGDRLLAHAWLTVEGRTFGHAPGMLELTGDGA